MLSEIFSSVLPESSEYQINDLDKNQGIVFTSDLKGDARISWTLPELMAVDRTYMTLATFFGRKRQRRFIRHILGFAVDFDTPEDTTPEDILDLYHKAKLPLPELIIATATKGHYQAFNLLSEPLRARHDLILAKANKIHGLMTEKLGGDIQAIGVERWVRRPHENNIVYEDLNSRTSWIELSKWYEAYKPIKKAKISKGIYINKVIDTPAGQRIQEPAAEKGCRNEWCYGLGLSLYDAGVPAEEIRERLHNWNKAIVEPLSTSRIEIIFRSVMSGRHHASSRVLEQLTNCSARIISWYKFAKLRDRRQRNHLKEVRQDIIADLESHGIVTETQKAWANRLGVAYRTLQLVLTGLRQEGIVEAAIGRGRYAQSSYMLSEAYKEAITSAVNLAAAAGAEGINLNEIPKTHTAYSPSMGTRVPSLPDNSFISQRDSATIIIVDGIPEQDRRGCG